MPIFEFACEKCGGNFDQLMPAGSNGAGLKCPSCGSEDIRRLMSLFGISGNALSKPTSGSTCSSCSATSCSQCH